MKAALITGVTGQDGSYLSEFLLEKGYEVHGIIRRSSVDFRERVAHLEGKPHFHLHYADLGDSMSIVKVVSTVRSVHKQNEYLRTKFASIEDILAEMRSIRCIEHEGRLKFVTPFVGAQVDVCKAFGFEIPDGCAPTYTSRKKSLTPKRGRPAKPTSIRSYRYIGVKNSEFYLQQFLQFLLFY